MRSVTAPVDALRDAADRVEAMAVRLVAGLVQHRLRTFTLALRDVAVSHKRLLALAGAGGRLEGRRSAGRVAVSLPGNAALAAPLTVIGAALLAGNRVVVRLPRRTTWLREALESVLLPVGLPFAVVDESGPEFVRRALAPGGADVTVLFGDDRWALEYEDLARKGTGKVIVEGPGKDPFLVLPGADIDAAAEALVRGGCYNGGQACTSPERAYVHVSLLEPFLVRLLSRVETLVVGPADDPRSDIGPFTSPTIVDRILRQVTGALAQGARLLWPAGTDTLARAAPGGGTFLRPMVLTDVRHDMAVMREETFGPVFPIMPVASVEEAVTLAENSAYGLSATVFGGSPLVAARLRRSHGLVFENEIWLDFYDREPLGPVGGFKRSGWVWQWQGDAFVRREGARDMVVECSRPVAPGVPPCR